MVRSRTNMDDTKLALEAVFVRTTKALETESAIEGLLSEPETNLDIRRQREILTVHQQEEELIAEIERLTQENDIIKERMLQIETEAIALAAVIRNHRSALRTLTKKLTKEQKQELKRQEEVLQRDIKATSAFFHIKARLPLLTLNNADGHTTTAKRLRYFMEACGSEFGEMEAEFRLKRLCK